MGKGAQDTWRLSWPYGGRLDKTGATPRTGHEARLEANQNGRGVHGPAFKPLQTWEGLRKKAKVSNRTREIWPSGIIGGLRERSSRQGRSLAGCESPYRQLPVFGRLAYPMRGEATNRVLLGRKSPGCPAGVFAAVGTIWGASKLGGRNITEYLQPRKPPRTKSFQAG